MMRLRLAPHPDTPSKAIEAVGAEIARQDDGALVIRYTAVGDVQNLLVPEPARYSTRQAELWRTTCFEAFAATGKGGPYIEFNFSPSTGWASYRFESYRHGGMDSPLPAPHIDVDSFPDRLEVTVAVDTTDLADLPIDAVWRLNLTAVIEEISGHKSYWALAHPPSGPPDFHHPDCFVLELPPATAA